MRHLQNFSKMTNTQYTVRNLVGEEREETRNSILFLVIKGENHSTLSSMSIIIEILIKVFLAGTDKFL